MRNYYINILVLIVLGFCSASFYGQQDAQYTHYMYNTLSVNPGYAGSRKVFSFVGLYRAQWVGLDGSPRTLTGSAHTRIGEKIGVGLNITNDQIFITKETYFDAFFSYTFNISEQGELALGLKGGAHLLDIDSNRLNKGAFNPSDPVAEFSIDNKFSPQVGLGLYYYTQKYYLGLSVPNILQTKHFDEASANTQSFSTAKERINYYLISGYVFDINQNTKFKPAGLLKVVEGSPLQVDISANFLLYNKLTLGAAYRWSAAFSGLVGFQIHKQLMIGFAYDRETTKIQEFNSGSFEFFLRYELIKPMRRLLSPRFF